MSVTGSEECSQLPHTEFSDYYMHLNIRPQMLPIKYHVTRAVVLVQEDVSSGTDLFLLKAKRHEAVITSNNLRRTSMSDHP